MIRCFNPQVIKELVVNTVKKPVFREYATLLSEILRCRSNDLIEKQFNIIAVKRWCPPEADFRYAFA
jgi:hypothetical protein